MSEGRGVLRRQMGPEEDNLSQSRSQTPVRNNLYLMEINRHRHPGTRQLVSHLWRHFFFLFYLLSPFDVARHWVWGHLYKKSRKSIKTGERWRQ
ncbi:hypothetical protein CDAR_259551 [Caerostris darwini]|uniref:Uncharacterized protein n=1 Tax=Caerostris darwini TaxID=1538125 RepID=A0AAV4VNW7_9ARAC|nr:hypothetical protein CDAR_259551 [Caerostris darwini]